MGKQICITNPTNEVREVVVNIAEMSIETPEQDGEGKEGEIMVEGFEFEDAGSLPMARIEDNTDSESEDMEGILRVMSHSCYTYKEEMESMKKFLDDKCGENPDANKLMAVVLEYVVGNKTSGSDREEFPSVMNWEWDEKDGDDTKPMTQPITPLNYYSVNQFQTNIIDITHIPKDMMDKRMRMKIPAYRSITLILMYREVKA